jgi:BolA protein
MVPRRKERIERVLRASFAPALLEVVDESARHSVPEGAESHFHVVVVSDGFDGRGRLDRHRAVHALLADELAGGLHALTLTLLTPAEHAAAGGRSVASPPCLGGSKAG